MSKIKVIMCPADRAPYVTNIENTLRNMQNIVGGYIEARAISTDVVAVFNEEGRIRGLPENMSFCFPGHCGDIFMCGVDGDEFADIPESARKFLLQQCKNRWNQEWENKHGI